VPRRAFVASLTTESPPLPEDIVTDRLVAARIATFAYITAGFDRARSDIRPRGVVSVEYIVLAAAIVGAVVYLVFFAGDGGSTEASRWRLR
jgi:hypothetical protein